MAVLAVAAIGLVAAVAGATGGDEESTPPTPPTPSVDPGPARQASTTTVAGAPLLGRATGWHLLAAGSGNPIVVELDTGAMTEASVEGTVVARTPAGVVTAGSSLVWRPFPFDDGDEITLAGPGRAFPAPEPDLLWVVEDASAGTARLVSLVDGGLRGVAELPPDATIVGAHRDGLVIEAGGDTFVLDPDGSARHVFDGTPIAVVGEDVLVWSCDTNLSCTTASVHLPDGRVADGFVDVPGSNFLAAGPAHPDGRLIVHEPGAVSRQRFLLVGPAGAQPVLPANVIGIDMWGATWSPDGTLLFARQANDILVVDPFAAGGPRLVTSFGLTAGGSLAVLAPTPS